MNEPANRPKNQGGKTKFAPGKSGNPVGRPKVAEEFRAKARRIVDAKVLNLWEAEIDNDGPDKMKASELLAAYGYGKPAQAIELSGPEGAPVEFIVRVTGNEMP